MSKYVPERQLFSDDLMTFNHKAILTVSIRLVKTWGRPCNRLFHSLTYTPAASCDCRLVNELLKQTIHSSLGYKNVTYANSELNRLLEPVTNCTVK